MEIKAIKHEGDVYLRAEDVRKVLIRLTHDAKLRSLSSVALVNVFLEGTQNIGKEVNND
jgi:hypothetical protein